MTTVQRQFARRLRHGQTSAEDLVWQQLRGRRLDGSKFRRQVPIGPYIVDFVCIPARLVVEIDGAQHVAQATCDDRRTAEIEAQGLAVIRFGNQQVRERLDDGVAAIRSALKDKRGSPLPGGRGSASAPTAS